jgi:hypothetical protein
MNEIELRVPLCAEARTPGSAGCQPAVAGSLPATLDKYDIAFWINEPRGRLGKLPRRAGWQPALPESFAPVLRRSVALHAATDRARGMSGLTNSQEEAR